MYDLVTAALQGQDLPQAARLLKQWQQTQPQDPWLKLAMGHYWEAKGELEKAQAIYTRLLQTAANTKLLGQAREGVQRLRDQWARRRQQDLSAARGQPGAEATAMLVLQPVMGAQREPAIQGLSQIMQLDAYTARLKLPTQHWRLYRVGPAGELRYFCEQLTAHQTPAFWASLEDVKAIPVFRVLAIQSFTPQLTVICQNPQGQRGTLQLHWQEITQWVLGQLPIYESVVDLDPWGKLKRKETTQDYAEILDWHLHRRGCVLRFCDRTYRYREAAPLPTADAESTATPLVTAVAWKALKAFFQESIQPRPCNDFTGFGAGALDFMDLLPAFETHLDLARQEPTPWDGAFHLYSSLRFLLSPAGRQ
ncbi:MAG TPA: tetratricopeptide repeat protein [Leptolyngbyaceae cyanobacterium M65_K2018_010]|nr:tetratricopeptide repeat protein [Leptolyngbyaceae cyanobacterium M65_K2018_010]